AAGSALAAGAAGVASAKLRASSLGANKFTCAAELAAKSAATFVVLSCAAAAPKPASCAAAAHATISSTSTPSNPFLIHIPLCLFGQCTYGKPAQTFLSAPSSAQFTVSTQ